ncbi:hypothetical protein K435DRAFT_841554 [Dendrothele bispora CBS 962.96]|uniref:Uncharacterized protein n=1 Tax=Dendrothele bispora (strain CBS 962.96) TaxID=1314807 RepID=A0A4S8LLU9_DENBC|nr:hypothetical protein K435DRAFT_841554 [Dendrothele bispora CBS 962.96]
MLLAGDMVMVWRTWVIWTGNGFVRFILVLLMLANIALNLVPASTELNSPASIKLSVAIMFLSFFTNGVATALIYLKAWLHQRMFKKLEEKRKTDVTRTLYLLVESGALYGIIQLLYPILQSIQLYSPLSSSNAVAVGIAVGVTGPLFTGATAIYPVAVIILIYTRRSYVDEITFVRDQDIRSNRDIGSSVECVIWKYEG